MAKKKARARARAAAPARASVSLPRISSGVKGLDKLVQGGFEQGSLVLVSGGTGTGKTIFGLQFLYDGAKLGEPGIYITFEENPDDLKRDARVLGMDLESFEKKGRVVIKNYPPFAFDQFINDLEKIIVQYKIKRMVVDSISAFGIYSKNEYEIRKRIYSISKLIKASKVTAIAISEVIGEATTGVVGAATFSRFGVEEFVADALVMLHYAGLGGSYDRTLQVVKMRRTDHARGLFPIKIAKNGIEVVGKQE
jgi:circadian clock protein KaiC